MTAYFALGIAVFLLLVFWVVLNYFLISRQEKSEKPPLQEPGLIDLGAKERNGIEGAKVGEPEVEKKHPVSGKHENAIEQYRSLDRQYRQTLREYNQLRKNEEKKDIKDRNPDIEYREALKFIRKSKKQ